MNRYAFGAVGSLLAFVVLALPAAALASAPGPPNVEVIPPDAIVGDRDGAGVTFDPGLIRVTYADGTQFECVLDPLAPPNPCAEITR